MLLGESFLLYELYEANGRPDHEGHIFTYATPENLQNLFTSNTWFVDSTFKCGPSIFYQSFIIMGAVLQVNSQSI